MKHVNGFGSDEINQPSIGEFEDAITIQLCHPRFNPTQVWFMIKNG